MLQSLYHLSGPFVSSTNLLRVHTSPIIKVIKEDVEQYWPQDDPWGYTTAVLLLAGFCATDHNPLTLLLSSKYEKNIL